jgi:hypothetical protein
MQDAADWGVEALERAARGLTCKTAVHICYGYGIKANVDWKQSLGTEWRQYEQVFPALAKSSIDQVSLECFHSHVPPDLMALLAGKDVMVGVIDVASDEIETAEQVAETIGTALQFVPKHSSSVHQLRHGTDAARGRDREAGCARRRAPARARAPRMTAPLLAAPITAPARLAATLSGQGMRCWPRPASATGCRRGRRAGRAARRLGRSAGRHLPARRRPLSAGAVTRRT